MASLKHVLAALLAASAMPAAASVLVVGGSSARICYEAADASTPPTIEDVRNCDRALAVEQLSRRDTVATHVNRGILRLRRGGIDDAITDFDTAMGLDPMQPEAYLNKGAALIRMNNPTEALRLFTVALDYHTRRPEIAHFGRAIANEELGNVREAYYDYRRASELAPHWSDPRTELRRFRVVPDPE